jgi:superfamily I DNA and/or RNA helicase
MVPTEEQTRIREFIQALNEEIEAIQQHRAGGTIMVFNGWFKRREGQFFIYIFTTESPLVVIDDAPAKIEINNKQIDGQVISVQENEVAVGIKCDLGEIVHEARLTINLTFLLEALRNRYEQILSGQRELETLLAQKLFGSTSVTSDSNQDELHLPSSICPPNEEQIKAIRAACGSDVHFIWGPPGTGKTRTIGFLIAILLQRNFRVLTVAHTNVATDNVIAIASELIKDTADYQSGRLVRYGNISPNSDLPEMVILDRIADRLGFHLKEQIAILQSELQPIQSELKFLKQVGALLIRQKVLLQKLGDLESNLKRCYEQYENVKVQENILRARLQETKDKLAEALTSGRIKRFFRGLDPVKLRAETAKLETELSVVQRSLSACEEKLDDFRVAINRTQAEANRCAIDSEAMLLRYQLDASNLSKRVAHLSKQEGELNAAIRKIEDELEALLAKILHEAKVIATSLTKASTDSQIDDQKFDVLVVDEASVAPLPSLYFAACRVAKKVVVVGDFRQLAPIYRGKTELVQKWLARDIFSEAGIQQVVDDGQSDLRLTLLPRQYRMHPDISAVSNAIIYGGQLIDSVGSDERQKIDEVLRRSPFPFDGSPLILCDTSSINPWSSRLNRRRGRYNLYSAVLSAEIAKRITQAGIKEVGVISPYVLQARLIKKIIDDSNDERYRCLKFSTVHGFQGREEDVIIFDVAEGPPVPPWFANGVELSSDGARLINVSITRPKAQLIIIANINYLESTLESDAVLIRILDKIRRLGGRLVNSQEILSGYFCSEFERWAEMLAPHASPFDANGWTPYTEQNFYPAFFTDLCKAEKEIIIVSPFLTIRRTQQFFDLFQSKISKGVRIRVVTRSLAEREGHQRQMAASIFDQMRRLHAQVIERHRAHQKLAFIDRKIVWGGSLNIMSRSEGEFEETQEHMWRIGSWDRPATKTCEELIKLHKLD